jgi:hypothetical protein
MGLARYCAIAVCFNLCKCKTKKVLQQIFREIFPEIMPKQTLSQNNCRQK